MLLYLHADLKLPAQRFPFSKSRKKKSNKTNLEWLCNKKKKKGRKGKKEKKEEKKRPAPPFYLKTFTGQNVCSLLSH